MPHRILNVFNTQSRDSRWFQGKGVAITGAGSGIGRATALAMARRGANLALADVNEAGLAATAADVQALGVRCTTTRLDVADREAVQAWATASQAALGQVNVIINNAGVSLGGVVEDLSYEDFQWIMNINFWGVVHGTKAFLPLLRQSGDGHVVNISSLFGLMAMPAVGAYNASKFAVRGFTEALSEELMIEGAPVEVTSVHPGGIDTNIARGGRVVPNRMFGLVDAETSGKHFKKLAKTTPDAAAEAIVGAILARERRLLIGNDARAFDVLQRLLPSQYQRVVAYVSKRQRAGR